MDMEAALHKAQAWLCPPYDSETRDAVRDLIDNDPDGLYDAFYRELAFGTAGIRGIMGVGTNRINRYTIGRATQGLADYLKERFHSVPEIKVAIAYDCRHHSKALALSCANILSANGIKACIFEELRPTPALSYAVRHLRCQAGIVLTASHNPPEYNGYKVYGADGAQVVPPWDQAIVDRVNKTLVTHIKWTGDADRIQWIGQAVDDAFIRACLRHAHYTTRGKSALKIAFTPLHGTSITLIPKALRAAGFENIHIAAAQAQPDGDFPTVESPNPEEPAALQMVLNLADEVGADIAIGTDPDADRIGIGVRDLQGRMVLLNGNQTNTVLISYLLERWRESGRLNGAQFICSTLVSSDIFYSLAREYETRLQVTLTGFKWIGKAIREAEGKLEFIGGGEESFGFMVGDFVRDKDAIAATLLACEIAAVAKAQGSSFFRELLAQYMKHDLYRDRQVSITEKGAQGAKKIQRWMQDLRENPYKALDGSPVIRIADYQTGVDYRVRGKTQIPLRGTPRSNVLIYYTEAGGKVAVRPSGTEPKIKFYISVKKPLGRLENYRETQAALDEKIDRITAEMGIAKG